MARVKYLYTDYSFTALKNKVQERSGLQVSTMRSCTNLANKLAAHNLNVSAHTIARFFKVIRSSSMPSLHTINQLAIYVGSVDWETFHSSISSGRNENAVKPRFETDASDNDSEMSLVRFCLQDGVFTPLANYFHANRDVFSDPDNQKTISLFSTLTDMLNSYPKIRHRMFSYMLQEDYLGKNYFTYQINADAIATHYGDSISQYFLRTLHPSDILYKSQITWANTILMTQAFYQGNSKKLLQYGYDLFKISPPEANTLAHYLEADENQVWVFARYHFVHILYLYYSGKANSNIMEQKVRFIIDQLANATYNSKLVTYSFIFEALTFSGHQNLIACFTNDFISLITSTININDLKGESLKAFTAVIFFFTMATSSHITNSNFEAINTKLKDIKGEVATSNGFKLYKNTYHVYMHSLEALLADNPILRQQYLNDARQSAQNIKNKYFIQQIDKMEL